jgi:hypothetical protein
MFNIYNFRSEVSDFDYTPDYYGFDSFDYDKWVLIHTFKGGFNLLTLLFNNKLEYILNGFTHINCQSEQYFPKITNNQYETKVLYLHHIKGANTDTTKSIDKTKKLLSDDVIKKCNFCIYKVPTSITQIDLDLSPYYRIYLDGRKTINLAVKYAIDGKQVYINPHIDDRKILKATKTLNLLSTLHICDDPDLSLMDVIVTDDHTSINLNILNLTPYHPDVFIISDHTPRLDITNYFNDGNKWVHYSRLSCENVPSWDWLISSDNLQICNKYHIIPSENTATILLRNYRCKDKAKGSKFADFLSDNNIINNDIVFEAYIILWYVRGQNTAEKYITDHIDMFTPVLSMWNINWGFISDKVKEILLEKGNTPSHQST